VAVQEGYGHPEDLHYTEEGGCLAGADADEVSARARERGSTQLGTLGGGNHFVELDVIDEVFLPEVAAAFGLEAGNWQSPYTPARADWVTRCATTSWQ